MTRASNHEKTDFLKRLFVSSKVDSKGENIAVWCPYCKNSNKSKLKLFIHIEKGFYHCWVCDKKGSTIHNLVKKVNMSFHKESLELYKSYGPKKIDLGFNFDLLNFDNDKKEAEEINVIEEFPRSFDLLANAFNSNDPDVKAVFKYALSRGFDKHKLYMLRAGFSKDKEFNRSLILPSIDVNGNLNFFTSRKIDASSSDSFKYNNSKVSKKNIIFNEVNIDWQKELVIVEGPLDLIKTPDNSTCLLGSSLTEDMLLFAKIVKNSTPVVLALDSDVYSKTVKIAKTLSEYDVDVRIADTRMAEDVGDMKKEQVLKIIEHAKPYNKDKDLLNLIKRL